LAYWSPNAYDKLQQNISEWAIKIPVSTGVRTCEGLGRMARQLTELGWIEELLPEGYRRRTMFGGFAYYLGDRAKQDPAATAH